MATKARIVIRVALIFLLLTALAFTLGCSKRTEATYTIGVEDVPDLEKGEQEVKGEKATNPLEAISDDEDQDQEEQESESNQ